MKVLFVKGKIEEHKNILFIFKPDDFRVKDGSSEHYEVLGEVKLDQSSNTVVYDDVVYHVYPDWSVKEKSKLKSMVCAVCGVPISSEDMVLDGWFFAHITEEGYEQLGDHIPLTNHEYNHNMFCIGCLVRGIEETANAQ